MANIDDIIRVTVRIIAPGVHIERHTTDAWPTDDASPRVRLVETLRGIAEDLRDIADHMEQE